MILEITVALGLLILILLLLAQLLRSSSGPGPGPGRSGRRSSGPAPPPPAKPEILPPNTEETRPCPLCQKQLYRGERIYSHAFTRGEDKTMHIYGCPYCYPGHPQYHPGENQTRKCPRCSRPLQDEDYLIARQFEKKGKIHVHVLGCPACRHFR